MAANCGVHEAYRQFARRRLDAVNHALAGTPEERVRCHLCWRQLAWAAHPRSAARAHHRSRPRGEGADLFLRGRQCAARARMAGMAERKIAPGKTLMPGVVSHATNLVEHPQLVADRIR